MKRKPQSVSYLTTLVFSVLKVPETSLCAEDKETRTATYPATEAVLNRQITGLPRRRCGDGPLPGNSVKVSLTTIRKERAQKSSQPRDAAAAWATRKAGNHMYTDL
ncbi:hypothetical protein BC826DRAFT_982785 [Russula brevipes]|nr:hypothetical protein BC826DRAFT_982785 [Russula brevipes]